MTATAQKHDLLVDADAVDSALQTIIGTGPTFEIRALEATGGGDRWVQTWCGWFDDPAAAAEQISELETAKGIYFTLNPVHAALLARAYNKLLPAKKTPATADTEILKRRWLPIDCDPVRPAGVPSSDDEHTAALERAMAIRDELTKRGWPEPIFADSGNGGHLLYQVDLPRDDGGLVERTLKALAKEFNDEQVKVDTSVHNPARIWRCYGALNCKGDSAAAALGRPQRRARIFS